MGNVATFESREAKLNSDIESEVLSIRKVTKPVLPFGDTPLTNLFVKKIEGTYDVTRAKIDTDDAIDLLYIAYNTTPQQYGQSRVEIAGIMDAVLSAQQQSELVMRAALGSAATIMGKLKNFFPDWLDAKAGNKPEDIKAFVSKDLLAVVTLVRDSALSVREKLLTIATLYDQIIAKTAAASATTEKALGSELEQKALVEKEISETNAKREQLEALVKDLQDEVAKYDKMARDYEARANTAEERAFIMSIVRVGAQMISGAIPAIAMAAAGPAGAGAMLASSTLGAAKNPASSGAEQTSKDNEVIQTKAKVQQTKSELKASEDKCVEISGRIKDLEAEKKREAEKPAAAPAASSSVPPSTGNATAQPASGAKSELDNRIESAKAELVTEQEKSSKLKAALMGLSSALDALDKSLSRMSDEQQAQATSLRDMQMKMLDKVETYEKARREQSAELVRVRALLQGKQTQEEQIKLAISSLNVSISALKRMKEVIQEIAFFFKSFADFMGQVAEDARLQLEILDAAAASSELRANRLERLVESTDDFFIKQAAQWSAVSIVSDTFSKCFAAGWSKVNKLGGKYITGDELMEYFKVASEKLNQIVASRDEAAKQKLADLASYRQRVAASAAAS